MKLERYPCGNIFIRATAHGNLQLYSPFGRCLCSWRNGDEEKRRQVLEVFSVELGACPILGKATPHEVPEEDAEYVQVGSTIPRWLKAKLVHLAEYRGRTIKATLEDALIEGLEVLWPKGNE